MLPLEQLFHLEVEFHRKLRTLAPGAGKTSGLHTSYAMQSGYEQLIRMIGNVSAHEIEQLGERLMLSGDTRDLMAARDSLKQLLTSIALNHGDGQGPAAHCVKSVPESKAFLID